MLRHQTNSNTDGHRTFDPNAFTSATIAPSPLDPEICWQLWEVRQAHFYKLCLRWLNNNHADADDAFNTAALAIWRKTQTEMPVIVNPMGWLTGLVRHACLDLHRKRQKEASQTVAIDARNTEAWADAPLAASLGHSPEAIFLQQEKCTYVHHAIDALPTRLRMVVMLRFYQEQSYKEIAVHLRLSLDNVYKRMQEARAILAQRLQMYLAGMVGPDLHTAWPDGDALFQTPIPACSADADATDVCQPRVTALTHCSKREEQKLRTLRAYVERYPSGWKKRLELADQLGKLNYLEEAVAAYEQVLEKQPRLISVWVQVGRVYQALGQNIEAVVAYEQALSLADLPVVQVEIASLIEKVVVWKDAKVENFRNGLRGSTYQ